MPGVTPFLWYQVPLDEVVAYYRAIFPEFREISTTPHSAAFEICGQRFQALNGGPHHDFSEAVSFVIECEDQAEVDHYWSRLTADGGSESMCGWLKDRYGLSWQVIPKALPRYLSDPDREKAERVTQAMLKMRKIEVAELDRAAGEVPA
jgi:predicted 3-demethylubiquinone-9 3-methyltransferase (glyoxalase superfamily)